MPTHATDIRTHNGVFLTGTGTGVGKTVVTAALACAIHTMGLKTAVMKPIETGVDPANLEHSDAAKIARAVHTDQPGDTVCQYRFVDPIAPLAAAQREGRTIDMKHIRAAYDAVRERYDFVCVEGAGGVLVPITQTASMLDLMALLELPCLIVGTTALGGFNHLSLTIAAVERNRIPILGVVFTQGRPPVSPAERLQHASTVELYTARHSYPFYGPLPHHLDLREYWDDGIARLSASDAMQALSRALIGTVK